MAVNQEIPQGSDASNGLQLLDGSRSESRAVMIAEMEIKGFNPTTGAIFLDPNRNSPRAQEFAEGLRAPIVGQERAVRQVSGLYQTFLAGMNPINRPIGTMLFLGPTDYGKTRVVEAAAEVVIDRSFVNCPRLRHFSKYSLLNFQ